MTAQATQSGLLLVVSAPSGAGKTTLVNALVSADGNIKVSVSHTTRPRRGAERDGAEYFFVDEATFAAMRGAGAFLEHAQVFGNSYGTSREAVERELAAGHDVLLEIDWQGAQQIRRSFPAAVSLFIVPPSRAALSARLQGRGVDDEAQIRKRTAEAVAEMSHHQRIRLPDRQRSLRRRPRRSAGDRSRGAIAHDPASATPSAAARRSLVTAQTDPVNSAALAITDPKRWLESPSKIALITSKIGSRW